MSTLQLFVTPDELGELIKELAAGHRLRACYYENGRFEAASSGEASVIREGRVVGRLFLFPADQEIEGETVKSKIRPRELGWLDIVPGRLVHDERNRAVLTLTTLQAEDKSHLPFKPTSWLRILKRNVAASFAFGVRGTNTTHGGSSDYERIGYSPRALQLHRGGALWKYQAGDNTVFEPFDSPGESVRRPDA